jgi:uncharacterized phage-associated protein
MTSAHDVAAYILRKVGEMSTMKLQKLVYYSQAWHLVWAEGPLFSEPIEAWANGPVVYTLFNEHRGTYTARAPWPQGDPDALAEAESATIDSVIEHYGKLSGRQLSMLTHDEAPWREARRGLGPTERSHSEVSLDRMAEYYSALDADRESVPVGQLAWPD